MFKTLRNAWKIAELRQKLMFTLMILLVYSLGNVIPVPFVDSSILSTFFSERFDGTALDFMNAINGSGLSQGTVFALGIQPYINSSIIIQLLCVAIPALERMAKDEGEEGKKKINKITRLTTIGLGLLMGFAYYMSIRAGYDDALGTHHDIITEKGFLPAVVIIAVFTAGSAVVMWLGEQINERGIGNGISMILFAGIIGRIPSMVQSIFNMVWWLAIIIVVGVAALILLIVYINDAERRIPVQYAKRVVGRKVYGGQSTNMPIKVAMSGVMPVIFAQSVCSLPATVCAFVPGWTDSWIYKNIFAQTSWVYLVFYGLMIFFFSWFYATIQYDPVEISNNLKSNGGFIPGFRPGKPTADFIKKVINKLVVFGAVYLAVVSLLPMIGNAIGVAAYSSTSSTMINLRALAGLGIGGTSIIILVGVALETVKALEAQMLMRHYKGFLD